MKRTITDFIDTEVKEYAISVVEDRAIPSVIDGLKPVQRKVLFTAEKVARKPIVTAALAGSVISQAGYFKGDASVASAASKMAQDFAGANNHPLILGKGEFGKRLTPHGIAAARYTKAGLHPNFDKFFTDKELLEYDLQDGQIFEPRYYLPVIPTVLLNGVSGIAVGFACEILPYHIKDIVDNVKRALSGQKLRDMKPHYEGYKGKVEKVDGKWVMKGVYKKINTTTLHITELPCGMSRDRYIAHLNKLEERDIIKGYDDKCKKEFDFTIYLTRKEMNKLEKNGRIESTFKLKANLSQNLNVLTEHGKLRHFETVQELIEYFVEFRTTIMTKRKEFYAQYYREKLSYAAAKGMFINKVLTNKFNLRAAKSRADLIARIEKIGKAFRPHSDRLAGIPIYHFTKEEIANLKSKCGDYQKQQKYFEDVKEETLFKDDLSALINNLKRGK